MPSPNPALAPALSAGEAARAPALVTRLHHLRVGHRHQPHLVYDHGIWVVNIHYLKSYLI